MRKISLALVAAMLLSIGSVFANDVKGKNPSESISAQISKMLSRNELAEELINSKAQVRFTVNNENEIVVLSVDSENDYLVSFLKSRLNYRKIQSNETEEGELFTVSVRVAS